MSVALILGALFALACVLFVARPFLLDPEAKDDELDQPTAEQRRRFELLERRDRALAALKELEFDHRSGKVSDEDYRVLVGGLRREAAEALRPLERSPMLNLEPPRQPDIPEPYPPPGELDPPSHPDIPEPYPPPGETEPPAPPQVPEPYPGTEPQL
jgi:hypothetical protein